MVSTLVETCQGLHPLRNVNYADASHIEALSLNHGCLCYCALHKEINSRCVISKLPSGLMAIDSSQTIQPGHL